MRTCLAAVLMLGCKPLPALPEPLGRVEGSLSSLGAGRGTAWLFLYPPDEGPPNSQAVPRYVTAVPEVRIALGDGRYVFSGVAPGAYRLWGFLDTNNDFRTDVDVLAQPGAGDRPLEARAVEVTAGESSEQAVTPLPPYRHPPPAFRVDTAATLLELPDQPLVPVTLTLLAENVFGGSGQGEAPPARFAVSLLDADGDGQPDDANGDGLPDLSPQLFLRFVPKPGQTVPTDASGLRLEVIVPLIYNPAPFLLALNGDLSREVVAPQLQALLVPPAQSLTPRPGLPPLAHALGAIPVGDYEVWAVARSGQFWRIPNGLGASAADFPGSVQGQALAFRFIHASR